VLRIEKTVVVVDFALELFESLTKAKVMCIIMIIALTLAKKR
jgi:hypothetical protein